MLVGRLFHAWATVTRNDRSPMVLSRVRRTIRRGQEPDRSRCRDSASSVQWSSSARYEGVLWLRQQKASTKVTSLTSQQRHIQTEIQSDWQTYRERHTEWLTDIDRETHRVTDRQQSDWQAYTERDTQSDWQAVRWSDIFVVIVSVGVGECTLTSSLPLMNHNYYTQHDRLHDDAQQWPQRRQLAYNMTTVHTTTWPRYTLHTAQSSTVQCQVTAATRCHYRDLVHLLTDTSSGAEAY